MDNVQFAIFIFTIISLFIAMGGMFFWCRSEARSDIRHMDNKLDSIRELVRAINDEVKDFHNRLCCIEEKRERK